jgi:hypothetical protein
MGFYESDDNIRQKSNIFNLNDSIQENKKNWYEGILRMGSKRNTQQILQYNPAERRDTGRQTTLGRWPLKRKGQDGL